ncbi:MAG: dual specificity protein phosphatase family protein [Desulfobulbus sp.]|nr:dual specificity protein phosphatase family protein [Desulfobulbus sp.]
MMILRAILLNLMLAASCCAQPLAAPPPENAAQSDERPAEWATPVDARRNLYRITPTLYRSAQLTQDDVALLQKLGIRTIINLRAYHRDIDVLNLPGVELVTIPMHTWHIEDEDVASALRAIAAASGPVLIHCQHGADRTGTVAAMYRIIAQGWTRERALRELRQGGYGFHPIWFNIPHYIERVDIEALRARLAEEGGVKTRP